MGRGVGADVVGQRRGDAAALEIHPVLVRHAIGFPHLPKRAAEPAATGPGPVMIEEGVPELVEQQSRQHVPGDLVAAPLAGDVAAIELDDLGRARRDPRDAGPEHDAVMPIANPRDDQQPSGAAQRPWNEVAPRRILAAPGARRHPVVHPAVAVRADVLKIVVAPGLRAPAPRAEPHRVHDTAAAAPVAARVVLEGLRRFERLLARVLVVDVPAAPGAERKRVRHHPSAVGAFGARLPQRVLPLEPPAATRAEAPEPLQLGAAARAAQLGCRNLALAHRAIASSTMRCTNALYLSPAFSAASAISCSAAMNG